MNRRLRLNWITSLLAAFALTASAWAAQQITANENTTNKVSGSRAYSSTDGRSKRVNVNTARKSELETLPGVGPALADNIIAARPFKSVSDLKSVSGIGDQRFQEILPHVTVGSTARHKESSAAGGPGGASSAYSSGSDKPAAEAQARSYTPAGSPPAPGANTAVTTDATRSGSDKPGAREKEETRASGSSARSESSSARNNSAKVDINTASKEQLEALPGIGPVKAQAIIDNRPYKTPEDIMKVNGIKQRTYDKIRDQITVR